MSNYMDYNFISRLNELNMNPEVTQEELDANDNLEIWSKANFTFDVPSGIGLLDDDFDVSLNKLESTDFTLVQPEISSFATPTMYHPLLSYQNPSTTLQPVVPISPAATNRSNNNYSTIYPAPSSTTTVIAQKDENSTTTTNTSNTSSRKNSKSTQSSSIDTEDTESQSMDSEVSAKMAAEEDKRRRNTAASARFRVKKKQREQALERTAKEMSQKAETLENRVKELEKEIRWLKNLIIEKDERLLDVEPPEKRRKAAAIKSETFTEESVENEDNEKK
ncbi:6379_t:CDS:1 [Diversispora eburnea]|uniref:6379_t:CDS:1 n=1 Tax=Diversispora eburnea TaxID=1213867 RepID=A0A9N8ZEB2_9GLOM|nr:6379_t:CDS:1 [Diversispora eburnea]